MSASSLVDDMRREFGECLRFAQGSTSATDSIDDHVRAFLQAAHQLQEEFARGAQEAADASAGSRDAADLTAEIASLKRELQEKKALLESHRSRLQRWQQECDDLQLSGPMLLPKASSTGQTDASGMDTSS